MCAHDEFAVESRQVLSPAMARDFPESVPHAIAKAEADLFQALRERGLRPTDTTVLVLEVRASVRAEVDL